MPPLPSVEGGGFFARIGGGTLVQFRKKSLWGFVQSYEILWVCQKRRENPPSGGFSSCLFNGILLKCKQCIAQLVEIVTIRIQEKFFIPRERSKENTEKPVFSTIDYEANHCRANGSRYRKTAGNRPSGRSRLLAAACQEPDAPLQVRRGRNLLPYLHHGPLPYYPQVSQRHLRL